MISVLFLFFKMPSSLHLFLNDEIQTLKDKSRIKEEEKCQIYIDTLRITCEELERDKPKDIRRHLRKNKLEGFFPKIHGYDFHNYKSFIECVKWYIESQRFHSPQLSFSERTG